MSCGEFAPDSFKVLKTAWLIEKLFKARGFLKEFYAPVNILRAMLEKGGKSLVVICA